MFWALMLPKNTLFGEFGQDISSVVWTLELAKEIHTTKPYRHFLKPAYFWVQGTPKWIFPLKTQIDFVRPLFFLLTTVSRTSCEKIKRKDDVNSKRQKKKFRHHIESTNSVFKLWLTDAISRLIKRHKNYKIKEYIIIQKNPINIKNF